VNQLTLFDHAAPSAVAAASSVRPDDNSERLLAMFEASRTSEGAHPRSVKREVGQLRALVREAEGAGQGITLRMLAEDVDLLARLLREPATMISRSTGRARLLAVQRFLRVVGLLLGRNSAADLAELDAQLPTRRPTGWHTTGALVAGTPARRRRRGPTLDAADLRRIVDAAGAEEGGQRLRDRALVALHCFSGLRPEEIVRLCWEDLASELSVHGRYGLTAAVMRGGRHVRLLLPEPASDAIEALAGVTGRPVEWMSGPIFLARGVPGRPISYRAAHDVIQDACHRAGLPPIESTALRAACAHWLRSQGLSDHEVASVLGLAKVRSVDRLLQRHAALDAQRTVRERLAR
jgi:integrase